MFQEYTLVRTVDESINIKSFYLKPAMDEPIPAYLAGQFVNVKVRIPGHDQEVVRSYTLSDSPHKEYLRLTIKRERGGKMSGYWHDAAAVGDKVLLSKPMGNFYLTNQDNPLVLISGGVGITPMLSMIEYLALYQPDREVYFIHSSTNKEVQPMLKRLLQLRDVNTSFHLSIFHTAPMTGERANVDYDFRGRITKSHLPVYPTADYFVCGPVGFMEAMFASLKEIGMQEGKMHLEFFGTERKFETRKSYIDLKSTSFNITLLKSSQRLVWKEGMGSLLELIESAGLNPDSQCRMGTCSTCETKLTTGTYEYYPEPFVETGEGNILICCARPTSDIEIEL